MEPSSKMLLYMYIASCDMYSVVFVLYINIYITFLGSVYVYCTVACIQPYNLQVYVLALFTYKTESENNCKMILVVKWK